MSTTQFEKLIRDCVKVAKESFRTGYLSGGIDASNGVIHLTRGTPYGCATPPQFLGQDTLDTDVPMELSNILTNALVLAGIEVK